VTNHTEACLKGRERRVKFFGEGAASPLGGLGREKCLVAPATLDLPVETGMAHPAPSFA